MADAIGFNVKIPKLPIWDASAENFSDDARFSSALWEKINCAGSTVSFSSANSISRLFSTNVGNVTITSVASTPHTEVIDLTEGMILILPINGEVEIVGSRVSERVIGGKSSAILGEGVWSLQSSPVSYVRIYFPRKIAKKLTSKLISEHQGQSFIESKDSLLLAYPDPDYMCDLIELIHISHKLEQRGLGKVISSELALVKLIENLFASNHRSYNRHDIGKGDQDTTEQITKAILYDLTKPLSLCEMEKITGVSRRSIQYSFKRRYGMSPIAWQLRERLTVAHAALVDSRDLRTITQIAFDLGFASSSTFSLYFRRQFGVAPSSVR